MTELSKERCTPLPQGSSHLPASEAQALLGQIKDWELDISGKIIKRTFRFRNFHETVAFVNAVAWIANQQDHHPDMDVHYNHCTVHFSTHSVGGLSRNDFICAARVNALFE